MPYSTWTFWFLAGGLVTVGLGLLLAPASPDEWVVGDEDRPKGPRARAERTGFAAATSGQVS